MIFARAGDAVRGAVAAQRALVAEPWPGDAPVRVRMGLHTGEVERAGTDVIGYAINRTARIAAAAHGGQVLLSDTTRALVADALPDGVTLRDVGEHRLRDLRAPERLAQLVIDGTPADFPPPRSLDARPNNLPTQLTTFVGREREVADASALLRETRLLTFTGPGGTGKTRLSLQVAAAAADDFPDGLWFVPLEPVRDPDLVAPTIARTLGIADVATRPPIDTLADAIGERRMLLVLDNFEQVVLAGSIITELLRRCPNITCLVTTRTALHVSGEQEYAVDGLPAPPDTSRLSEVERLNLPRAIREFDLETLNAFESVRLFTARASATRADFRLTSANAPAVAQICARLHGMPLAIELAAARVKLLTPDQILARLERHLALLTAGSRDLPERQQTLRGAIAWSYDLLDPGSRRLVDRLSVFRGGCDLETAAAVCGPAEELGVDVFEGLGSLVDQSLVRIDDMSAEPRFVMLDSIREFAWEMLEARGEADTMRDRHLEAFLELAERATPNLTGSDQRSWLDQLDRENDNLRAALDWGTSRPRPEETVRLAFALWRFWQQRGYLNEARARFEALAAQGWTLEPRLQARFAEAFGGIAYWQSDPPAATRRYDEALAIWRSLGDKGEIANALFNRSYADSIVVMSGGTLPDNLGSARAMLEEALGLYQEVGDTAGEGNALWGLGSFSFFRGDAADAETWFRRSLERHRASGHRTMEAWSLHMLALAAIGQRRFDEAKPHASHAMRHFYDAGDVSGLTLVLDDLGLVAVADGDEVRAGRLWGAARHLQQTTGTGLADYIEHNQALFGLTTAPDIMTPEDLATRSADGAAMGLDEIVAYALESTGTPIEGPVDEGA